jgi:hypothetical protein
LPQIEATKSVRPQPRGQARAVDAPLPEPWNQLRMLSLNLETSMQTLGEEAINLLFKKHRFNRIA